MRIEEFHIDGFGRFENLRVTGLGPGLSIILGRNESGKSTLLAFLRAVLFGLPGRKQAAAGVAGGPEGEQVISLTCEGAHPESPKPVDPGAYEVRFVPNEGAPGFVIQSPWGRFTATGDEGA